MKATSHRGAKDNIRNSYKAFFFFFCNKYKVIYNYYQRKTTKHPNKTMDTW